MDHLRQAVDNASTYSSPTFLSDPTLLSLSAKDDACENHPTAYFSSIIDRKRIERDLGVIVQNSLNKCFRDIKFFLSLLRKPHL